MRTPQSGGLSKLVVWIMGLGAENIYFGNHYLDAGLPWHAPILLLWYLTPAHPAAPNEQPP